MKLVKSLCACCALVAATAFAGDTAEVIYHGGPILTMHDAQPRAAAVAVASGKIAAVGSSNEVMKLKGKDTRIVDLSGQAMIPGFVDAHGHVLLIGLQALSANMLPAPDGEVNDIAALQRVLKDWADSNQEIVKKVNLIIGFGYDDAQLKELRHPTAEDLDQVSREIPVYIVHQSGHLGVANTKALEEAGITADSKDPSGGVIRRKNGGNEPNGVLEENAHGAAIVKLLSAVDAKGGQTMFMAGADLVTSYGYTTAQEGRATLQGAKLMQSAADAGGLKIDVVVYPDVLINDAKEFIKQQQSRITARHKMWTAARYAILRDARYRRALALEPDSVLTSVSRDGGVVAATCTPRSPVIARAWNGLSQSTSKAMTAACGTVITRQAMRAARSAPSMTGRERKPSARSPSMALKSLSVMMPCAPMPYSSAIRSTSTAGAPALRTAAPVIHGRVS